MAAKQPPAVRVTADAHAACRRFALELSPEVGRQLSLTEVMSAAMTSADRERLLAALKGETP